MGDPGLITVYQFGYENLCQDLKRSASLSDISNLSPVVKACLEAHSTINGFQNAFQEGYSQTDANGMLGLLLSEANRSVGLGDWWSGQMAPI